MVDYKSQYTGDQVDEAVGRVLDNNCIITYSMFEPRIHIWANCIIDNSIIYKAPPIESTALYSGCVVQNKTFHAIGTYTKEFFDTKQFKEFYKLFEFFREKPS